MKGCPLEEAVSMHIPHPGKEWGEKSSPPFTGEAGILQYLPCTFKWGAAYEMQLQGDSIASGGRMNFTLSLR